MRVTLYKDSAGNLHETYEAYAKAEEAIKIKPAVEKLVSDKRSALNRDDRDNFCLYEEDIAGFIADNAEALREILNGAVLPRRGRKAASNDDKVKAAA